MTRARATSVSRIAAALAILSLWPSHAFAHQAGGTLGGFASGFTHPILGLDHMLAMLAVGIWGAQIGGRSLWTMPVTFPLIMALGGFLGAAGLPFPYVEIGIASSVIVLGAVIAFKLKPSEAISYVIIGAFALCHGHAHGTELPQAADGAAYGIGFVLATGLIHLAGIGVGAAAKRPWEGKLARACGACISMAGVYILLS